MKKLYAYREIIKGGFKSLKIPKIVFVETDTSDDGDGMIYDNELDREYKRAPELDIEYSDKDKNENHRN